MNQQYGCSAVSPHNRRSASPSLLSTFSILLIGLISLGCPRSAVAQAVFGSINGTVTDSTGAIIPNATVTVTDVSKGTSQQVTTNDSGNYTVNRLIPDVYKVKVESANFTPAEADNVSVSADTSPQVNLQLQPAGATQTVTVTTAAPPLKTDRADVDRASASILRRTPRVRLRRRAMAATTARWAGCSMARTTASQSMA
jgi:cytoskeletal protein RodZ